MSLGPGPMRRPNHARTAPDAMASLNVPRACAATIVALALAVAGCGSDDGNTTGAAETTPSTSTAATAAAPTIPNELLGTYERRVTRADIERTEKIRDESGPNQEKPEPGPGRLIISASSLKFVVLAADPPFTIEQSITATADRLSIEAYVRPDKGSFCGPEIPQNTTYAWESTGDVLQLTAQDDPCADRDSSLTGSWKRQT
jgi:hypothetical protein